jgi:hypothetical protein
MTKIADVKLVTVNTFSRESFMLHTD